MPAAQAWRTLRYSSTLKILAPSLLSQKGKGWTTFTPPAAAPCRRFRGLISHRRSHATIVSVAYLAGWEGGQLVGAAWDLSVAITTPLLWDCVLDWIAVTLGAVTAAAIWQHRRRIVTSAVAATVIILTAGTSRRK